MATGWFDLLFRASWQGAVLAVIVLILLIVFGKRLSAGCRYLLLAVVLIRFLLPLTPSGEWSLFGFSEFFGVSQTLSVRVEMKADGTSPFHRPTVHESMAASEPFALSESVDETVSDFVPETRGTSPSRSGNKTTAFPWKQTAAFLWFGGMVCFGVRLLSSHASLSKKRKHWNKVDRPEIRALFERCRKQARLKRQVEIMSTDEPVGAASCGVFRPVIVISESMFERFEPEQLRLILLHEIMHHKRFDPLMHCLARLARVLHWPNPFVWILFRRLETERELAVDQAVVRITGTENMKTYGNAVLKAAGFYRKAPLSPSLLGFQSPDRFLERRIMMIIKPQRATWTRFVFGLLLVSGLTVTGLTDGRNENGGEPEKNEAPPAMIDDGKNEVAATEPDVSGKLFWGKVVNDENDKPFSGVVVTLQNLFKGEKTGEAVRAVTDSEGKVYLPRPAKPVDEGSIHFLFEKEGYVPVQYSILQKSIDGSLKAGQPVFSDVVMVEAVRLVGRVVSEKGEPLPNSSIRVWRERPMKNMPGSSHSNSQAKCDEKGCFEIPVGKAEKVGLILSADGYPDRRYFAKGHREQRDRIPLGDIAMKRGFRPSVQVLDLDGTPVSGARVRLSLVASESEANEPYDRNRHLSAGGQRETVQTDSRGKARFRPFEAGNFFIEVLEKPRDGKHPGEIPVPTVKGVFEQKAVRLTPGSPDATIQAGNPLDVTVHFSDQTTTPERESQMRIEGGEVSFSMNGYSSSTHSCYKGSHLGEGRFLFRVPERLRDAKLGLKHIFGPFKIDNELSYRCLIDGKEVRPADKSLYFPLFLLDGNKTVEIKCYKSPKLTLHVVDEAGKPIDVFFAGAQYKKSGQAISFSQSDEYVIRKGAGNMSSRTYWVYMTQERCIGLDMDVQFAWRNFGSDSARINYEGILPDEEMRLYVVGKGYETVEQTIPEMSEGEEREITVVLSKPFQIKPLEGSIIVDIGVTPTRRSTNETIWKIVKTKKGEPFRAETIEEDKQALMETGLFHRVKPSAEWGDEGVRVVFELEER